MVQREAALYRCRVIIAKVGCRWSLYLDKVYNGGHVSRSSITYKIYICVHIMLKICSCYNHFPEGQPVEEEAEVE